MHKDLKLLFGSHHGLDEKSIGFLTKALEKNNLPGFDYIEYKQALGALLAMDMDEGTAFKSAFATASTMGLTKEKLLKTADHYKKILANEKEQFDAALQKQLKQRVQSKEEEVIKLKKQVEEYKAKIQKLEEQIAKSQNTIDHADEHIQAAKEKIVQTRDNFEYALQSIVNEINKDIDNIGTFL
jgi:DNA repair exonuclease SbcCD ATPase subunit